MADVKVTKANVLKAMAQVVADDFSVVVDDVTVTAEDVKAYIDTTLAQLAAKNEKAKERAAEKRAEGDALRAKIAGVLTEEYKTIAQIIDELDVEDLTPAKVVSRLGQLVRNGEAHKTEIKEGDRKVKAYAAGAAE